MVIGCPEDIDFAVGQGGDALVDTFDCDGTALPQTLVNESSLGTNTWRIIRS